MRIINKNTKQTSFLNLSWITIKKSICIALTMLFLSGNANSQPTERTDIYEAGGNLGTLLTPLD